MLRFMGAQRVRHDLATELNRGIFSLGRGDGTNVSIQEIFAAGLLCPGVV